MAGYLPTARIPNLLVFHRNELEAANLLYHFNSFHLQLLGGHLPLLCRFVYCAH